jgi:hypothetical protein
MRRVPGVAIAAVVAFALVTLVALEGREVVVLETTGADGRPRRTRTWIADDGASAWIEAATPDRPFLLDLQRTPALVLERGGVRRPCRAEIAPDPEGHERIRAVLRARYGWADRWIGLVADTRRSRGVRLECP